MNSLSLGFVYITGLSVLLVESGISASNGNWTPLILFCVFFTVMFSVLGCLKISTKAVEVAGPIFAALIGVGVLIYAIAAFPSSFIGGLIRLVVAAALIVLGLIGYTQRKAEESH